MDRQNLVAFVVSGRTLGLPLADVARVVAMPRLVAPAGGPPFLEGFFDLNGSDVAVLRGDRLLSLGEDELGVYSTLLLLRSVTRVALHVAAVDGLTKSVEVRPLARDETFNSCVTGRFELRGRPGYLLSAGAILLAEERARLAFLAGEMRRRRNALAADAGGVAHVA